MSDESPTSAPLHRIGVYLLVENTHHLALDAQSVFLAQVTVSGAVAQQSLRPTAALRNNASTTALGAKGSSAQPQFAIRRCKLRSLLT